MAKKYQFGGGDFFNSVADMANEQVDQQWAAFQASQQPTEETAPEEDPYADYDPGYEELSEKYAELEEKFNALQSRQTMNFAQDSFNDNFLDFLFSSDDNGPIDFDNLELDDDGLPTEGSGSYTPQGRAPQSSQPQYSLQMEISKREGNYSSVSPNSSGTGKYQFIWSIHGPNIQKVTGVRSREEFLRSPQAQEQFFQHWDQTTLTPEAERLLPKLRQYYPDITADQAKMMIHFGGAGNVQKAIRSGDFRSPLDANGTSLEGYVFRQMGGYVAQNAEEMHEGLNNPMHDQMYFPMMGTNTFRGLDSGEPVYLRDEEGNEEVLYGPHHTAQMRGSVQEHRLPKYQIGGWGYNAWNALKKGIADNVTAYGSFLNGNDWVAPNQIMQEAATKYQGDRKGYRAAVSPHVYNIKTGVKVNPNIKHDTYGQRLDNTYSDQPSASVSPRPENINASQDALNIFMGQKQKYNSWRPSPYAPTKASSKGKYYAFNNEEEIINDLFKYKNADFINSNEQVRMVKGSHVGEAALRNFKYSKGRDEKGDYVSYYDINDYGNVLDLIGEPFEIYGRIYYDKKTGKPITVK